MANGYGDSESGGGGYGDADAGYGHPVALGTVVLADGPYRHDQGGELCRFEADTPGTLPPGPYLATIGGKTCFSGIAGQGSDVFPDASRTYFDLRTPHLRDQEGAQDLIISGAFGSRSFTGAVYIVKATGHSGTVELARLWPPDVWQLRALRPRS